MLRVALLLALAVVAADSVQLKSAYSGDYNLQPVLSDIGLPSLYYPKYSLGGLVGYLKQKEVSQTKFITRVQKYGPVISGIAHQLRKQYGGVLGDLLQLVLLSYYGSEPSVNFKLPVATYFKQYIKLTKIPSPVRFNVKYVYDFLSGFKGYLRKQGKPQKIELLPAPPAYPGYELLVTLKSMGLPALTSPKSSLGGLFAYLEFAEISKTKFISRIQIYGRKIKRVVAKYQKQYKGIQLDILQVAALRYYGIQQSSGYKVSFSFALKQALRVRINTKYSVTYVRIFLIRFSKILITLPYPGYDMIPVLKKIGLPKLYYAKKSLGGLVAYLKIAKISQVTFVKRITKNGRNIKQIVLKYQKQYKGVQLDLIQVAALRYYGIYQKSAYKISFSLAIKKALPIRISTKYTIRFVSTFLIRFSKILVTLPFPGYDMIPVLKKIGLPKLYYAKYSLGGLVAYLKVAKISQVKFIRRITKYGGKIKQIVLKYQKRYKGIQLDLLQVAALRYYGVYRKSGYKINFSYALKLALRTRIYTKYSISYVSTFLIRFSKILVTPPYPGYDMIPVLKKIGLPKLYSPKNSLGGLIAYLKVAKISQVTFVKRITKYGGEIKQIVLKYKKQYKGVQLDLIQVAVLRYYGIYQKSAYKVSFSYAIKQALQIRISTKYTIRFVSTFLIRFSKILVTLPYPGYDMIPVLKKIGLPKLYYAKYSLGGLVAYLKVAKISQVTFVKRITKYGGKIKQIVLKYQKRYKGIQLDLLQVAALRYYGVYRKSGYKISFSYALKLALRTRIYTKYSISYVSTFLIRFSKILVTPPYPGYDMIPVLKKIGLPKLYSPKNSLGGLIAYLKVAKISQVTFVKRITKYGGEIKQIVLKYKKQYKGVQLDLIQVAVLRYYGIYQKSAYKVSFSYAIKQALQIRISTKYTIRLVSTFLIRFSKILVTLPYPGYDMIPVLKKIGLPKLHYARYSLGGLVAYLKVAKISQVTFVKRITKYSVKIKQIVLKYQKQYKGIQLDLLQVAALRYYGIYQKSAYKVSFSYALKKAIQITTYKTYSVKSVASFLVRFSKYLVKPVYPGYKLKLVLKRVGLPKLTSPKYSLAGLVGHLKSNNPKFNQAALISRIQKYGSKIKLVVLKYQKQYSGIRADLLQLCAIRFYTFPGVIRTKVSFGKAFQTYLSSKSLKLYNASVVKKFLSGFIKYIGKYQPKTTIGFNW